MKTTAAFLFAALLTISCGGAQPPTETPVNKQQALELLDGYGKWIRALKQGGGAEVLRPMLVELNQKSATQPMGEFSVRFDRLVRVSDAMVEGGFSENPEAASEQRQEVKAFLATVQPGNNIADKDLFYMDVVGPALVEEALALAEIAGGQDARKRLDVEMRKM